MPYGKELLDRLLPGEIRLKPSRGDYYQGTADAIGGAFRVTRTALINTRSCDDRQLRQLRRRMWEANRAGASITIGSNDIERLTGEVPSFKQRTDDLLDFIVSQAEPVHKFLNMTDMLLLVQAATIVGMRDSVAVLPRLLRRAKFHCYSRLQWTPSCPATARSLRVP